MTTLVLFHHVLGLTPGVVSVADSLRHEGLNVLTPDLFDGKIFDELSTGLAFSNELGDDELLHRAELACDGLPADVVYGGLSLGVFPAQHLLQTRPGAVGAVLFHSFFDPTQLAGSWPTQCPVEVFGMDHDPFFVDDGDLAIAQAWQRKHANLHIHLYPGEGHLFLEPSLPDYDECASRKAIRDLITTLHAIGHK
ncbi:dienelactone hydrolase family protein [Buchananella felis]|uniref:dienelactone hydrolase family protein n=1 Tax=Buchananella felis TaxID=3231492 RepID=UPI003528BAB8